jgi:hypothetical protein
MCFAENSTKVCDGSSFQAVLAPVEGAVVAGAVILFLFVYGLSAANPRSIAVRTGLTIVWLVYFSKYIVSRQPISNLCS